MEATVFLLDLSVDAATTLLRLSQSLTTLSRTPRTVFVSRQSLVLPDQSLALPTRTSPSPKSPSTVLLLSRITRTVPQLESQPLAFLSPISPSLTLRVLSLAPVPISTSFAVLDPAPTGRGALSPSLVARRALLARTFLAALVLLVKRHLRKALLRLSSHLQYFPWLESIRKMLEEQVQEGRHATHQQLFSLHYCIHFVSET